MPASPAIRTTAHDVDRHLTHTGAEVGAGFLARHGWYELIGLTGHFASRHVRACVAYWGVHLDFGWHLHAAEYLCCVTSGSALLRTEGSRVATLHAAQARLHHANQRHPMKTGADPILTPVLWRGPGLGKLRTCPLPV